MSKQMINPIQDLVNPDKEQTIYLILIRDGNYGGEFKECTGRTDTYETVKELIDDETINQDNIERCFILYCGDPIHQEGKLKGDPFFSAKPLRNIMNFWKDEFFKEDTFDLDDHFDFDEDVEDEPERQVDLTFGGLLDDRTGV